MCRTCNDLGDIVVPTYDGDDVVPCPHCRQEFWPQGFPGVKWKSLWLIEPTIGGCRVA